MRAYAKANNLGSVKMLEKHRDPDGGYEAVFQSHNFNPLTWVARKFEARGGGYEARLARAAIRERRRLQKTALLEAKLARKERKLLAKAKVEEAKLRVDLIKAKRETARTAGKRTRVARPRGMIARPQLFYK